jgi:hypothetical protein
MSELRALPCTIFDHRVYYIRGADGAPRRGRIALGDCLLLFTSLDGVYGYLDGCPGWEREGLAAAVFSKNRKQFGKRAREAVSSGVVGALIDPEGGLGRAPFLRFSKTHT